MKKLEMFSERRTWIACKKHTALTMVVTYERLFREKAGSNLSVWCIFTAVKISRSTVVNVTA